MEISKVKQDLLKLLPLYRWHPEVAIRYLPIVNTLKKVGPGSVLEIGSGGLGIAPYLGWKVVGLDLDPSGPRHPGLNFKKGSGQTIPYPDSSFDYVLAVDTFEHFPKELRSKVAAEMLRVARKIVVVAVPAGLEASRQDEQLSKYFLEKFHHRFPFFDEHQKYGLPEKEELKQQIEKADTDKKIAKMATDGNENLTLRYLLMKGWITRNFLTDLFHRKIMLASIPLFQLFDKPPYYRTIFTIKLKDYANWN